MAKTKIGGITVEIGADTSDLSKKLKDVNAESKKTTQELKSFDQALKQAPNSLELWKQKQEALSKVVENSKKKLEALVSEQENLKKGLEDGTVTEEAYKAFQREIEITKGQIESAEKALKDFTEQNEKAGAAAEEAGKDVEDSGKKAENSSEGYTVLKNAVANLAADGFEKLMKSAKEAWEEIDAGYDTIVAKTGATGDALESLQNSADNVFRSMPVEMNDVGSAIGEINTRFKLTDDELEDLTENFLKYSKINNTQVASSVKNVAGIMRAFQEDTSNAGNVLDVFTDVSQRTSKDISSLESELLSNSATFKELGFDIRQSAELMGQFEENGVDTSTALAGLKKAQQNAILEGKNLSDALSDTIKEIKGAKDETEALQIASDLFGKKGAAAMTQAIKEQRFSIDDLASGYEGLEGTVVNTFEATQSAPDKAKTALNNLKIELARLAETVLPKIEKLVDKGVQNLPKIEKTIKDILPLVKNVGTAYAAWKIGSTVGDSVKALKNLTVAMGTAEKGAKSLATVLDTGMLAAATLLATTIIDIGRNLKKQHDEYVPMAKRISDEVSKAFDKQREAIDKVDESIENANQSFKDSAASADYEADRTKDLWEELQTLADESGKVKDADKLRAEYILGELNEALGTEITMTGTQIENYKNLQTEIDKLIEKKRAAALIDAYQSNVGEMAQNKATVYEQYLDAYTKEKAALEEFNSLAQERYGRTFTPEEFQNLMAQTYRRNDVWNTIDTRMLGLAETAQTAGTSKQELQAQYDQINDYFNRLDDAQRAYSQQNYEEVEKRLYYQKDANDEVVKDEKATADELTQIYEDNLSKMQAAFDLVRKSHAKLAKSDEKDLVKLLIETATAGARLGGEDSGDVFSDEFKDIVQEMIDKGFDISDLARWGKDSGVWIGDIFGNRYEEVVQKQIDAGFDVTELLQWGASAGVLSATEYVKFFKENAQRELDSFFQTNVERKNEIMGPLTLDEIQERKNQAYGPSPMPHAAGGFIPVNSSGIVAEAGPELLEVMNGGVRVTNLTPSSAINTPVGAGGDTIIQNFHNNISAYINNDYDVSRMAERLATEEKRNMQGKGR